MWLDRERVLAAVKKNGYALRFAAEPLRADKAVVLAAVKKDGWALQYAAEPLKADREVVMAAVQQDGYTLRYAAESLRADMEVVLVHARHGTPTAALGAVCAPKRLPDWQDRTSALGHAVELLAAFPVTATSPKVHKTLQATVENMMSLAYEPAGSGRSGGAGARRDRAAFGAEFCQPATRPSDRHGVGLVL